MKCVWKTVSEHDAKKRAEGNKFITLETFIEKCLTCNGKGKGNCKNFVDEELPGIDESEKKEVNWDVNC